MNPRRLFFGRAIGILVVLAIAIGAYAFVYQSPSLDSGQNVSGLERYTNATYGLSFSYPAAYVLTERDAPGSELRKHHSIVLIHKENLPLPSAGEGPPSITIDIYQNNLDKQTTETWIRNSKESNFKLGDGTIASTTLSGLPALSYRWSGLYEGTTIVTANDTWIYALSVTYLEMGAPIVQDFVSIRDSVLIALTDQSIAPPMITFEECVAAGNPVMESYPRQCTSKDGKHFVENIGNTLEKSGLIRLSSPRPNAEISSPLAITGEARGNWYFEASFPVFLTDWDGKIIAQGIATAQGEWMTTEFVPFTATLTFSTADISGQYSKKGTLILKKDNPSGLPEHDDALEIPVYVK